jgi:hypothetical protein
MNPSNDFRIILPWIPYFLDFIPYEFDGKIIVKKIDDKFWMIPIYDKEFR